MVREEWDVLAPRAQRRELDGYDVEAMEQIFPKLAPRHGRREVDVGRRNHADVDAHSARSADAPNGSLLERPQQLALQHQWEMSDLVEKQRTPVCELEESRLGDGRAREGAFLVTE